MPRKPKSGNRSTGCDVYPTAVRARVNGTDVTVQMRDGRGFTFPMAWFKGLAMAPEPQRSKVRVMHAGTAIGWPDLSYELGVGGLLHRCERTRGCAISSIPTQAPKARSRPKRR